jgi:6,7-dimethyl-8-ribityllumazine synthase
MSSTSIKEYDPTLNGAGLRVGIVTSRFNKAICDGLLSACEIELKQLAVGEVTVVNIPGALEHPLVLQKMAQSGRYDALIAIGAVVRGETYHFEIVANESARGILDVQLETGVPIANAILTTENEDQAYARMHEKGADAARVAIEMATLLKRL